MFSGPGFSKPAHQYGQSSGDQAEVLDGRVAEAVEVFRSVDAEIILPSSADGWAQGEDWAGTGFTVPYQEPE